MPNATDLRGVAEVLTFMDIFFLVDFVHRYPLHYKQLKYHRQFSMSYILSISANDKLGRRILRSTKGKVKIFR